MTELRITNYELPAEVRVRSLEASAPIHNTPLLVFVELGVIGGLLYLAFLCSLLYRVFHIIRHPQLLITNYPATAGPRSGGGQLPAAIALLALTLLALFDHSFWTLHAGQMLFWTIAGLAVPNTSSHR